MHGGLEPSILCVVCREWKCGANGTFLAFHLFVSKPVDVLFIFEFSGLPGGPLVGVLRPFPR